MFSVSKRPEDTAIVGFSMGGYPDIPAEWVPNTMIENWDMTKKLPKFYYACGTKDRCYISCVKTKDLMLKKGVDVTWDEVEGYAHEWRFRDIEIEKFLAWLPRTDVYAATSPCRI